MYVSIPSTVRVGTLLMGVHGTPNGASFFEFELKVVFMQACGLDELGVFEVVSIFEAVLIFDVVYIFEVVFIFDVVFIY